MSVVPFLYTQKKRNVPRTDLSFPTLWSNVRRPSAVTSSGWEKAEGSQTRCVCGKNLVLSMGYPWTAPNLHSSLVGGFLSRFGDETNNE